MEYIVGQEMNYYLYARGDKGDMEWIVTEGLGL